MAEVIPHVNIQLNMLSHSPRSVDLSLLNRCCLNRELCKFGRLQNLSSPSTVDARVCACVDLKKWSTRGNEVIFQITSPKLNVPQWERRYAHTRLIFVISTSHCSFSKSKLCCNNISLTRPPTVLPTASHFFKSFMSDGNDEDGHSSPTSWVRFFFAAHRAAAVKSKRECKNKGKRCHVTEQVLC